MVDGAHKLAVANHQIDQRPVIHDVSAIVGRHAFIILAICAIGFGARSSLVVKLSCRVRRSFCPESEWKTRMIHAIHEALIGFGKDSLVGAVDALEHELCGNAL
jgi:hypothetical protein